MIRRLRRAAYLVALSSVLVPASASATTQAFDYTGAVQTWTVPAGVTSATFDLYGAEGGQLSISPAGKGGRATATLDVTPGQSIEIRVGGSGASGGFNGGGMGTNRGGGATDVRIGGAALTDRALVAGGGGGGGNCAGANGASAPGGAGGGAGGADALSTTGCAIPANDGKGATQSAGGAAGTGGQPGTLGQGGNAETTGFGSGGGGGGYYGGGGGGMTPGNQFSNRGGGGGSGFGPAGTTFETGVRSGDGQATVTYTQRFDLTATTSGTGTGRVTSAPAGIDCKSGSRANCKVTQDVGTQVTLTATADSGSAFTGWDGGGCSGTAPCTVTLDAAKTVDAAFTADKVPPDEPPVITSLVVTPKSFAPGPDPVKPRKLGATLQIALSEKASVKFRVRRSPARESGNPGSTARVFTRELPEGESSLPFSGTFRKTLKPGRYQVIAVATDSAGQTSEKARVEFEVR